MKKIAMKVKNAESVKYTCCIFVFVKNKHQCRSTSTNAFENRHTVKYSKRPLNF